MDIKILASGSTGNAYIVSNDTGDTVLLDAGIPFPAIQAAMRYRTSALDACLVTHRHGDHALAVPKLLARGIAVYGPADLKEICPGVEIIPEAGMKIGSAFKAKAFRAHHDVECNGYLLDSINKHERLLYMTDTTYTEYTFAGLTHVMIECNHSVRTVMQNVRDGVIDAALAERIIRSHMSIETVLGFLKVNDTTRLRQVYLLHLSDNNSDEETFKGLVQEETGAEVYVA